MVHLYLSSSATPYTPATLKGAWDNTTALQTFHLRTTKGGTGGTTNVSFTEFSADPQFDVLLIRAVSDGFATAGTISGSIDFAATCTESSTLADFVTHLHLWVTAGDSDTVRGTLVDNHIESLATREWAGSATGRRLENPVAVTPVTVQPGDRLVLEVGYRALNTSTAGRAGTMVAGGGGDDAFQGSSSVQNAGWIDVPDPVFDGTRFYLTNTTAPYTPATFKGVWDKTTGSVTAKLGTTKIGANTLLYITKPGGVAAAQNVLWWRGVSDPLAAQTFGGTVNLVAAANEDSISSDSTFRLHIYVTQGDSDLVRGTVIDQYVDPFPAQEFLTSAKALDLAASQTVSAVSCQEGDRLVAEFGFRSESTSGVAYGARLWYGGTGADLVNDQVTNLTVDVGHIDFSQELFEQEMGTGDNTPPARGGRPGPGKSGGNKPGNRPFLGGHLIPRKLRLGAG